MFNVSILEIFYGEELVFKINLPFLEDLIDLIRLATKSIADYFIAKSYKNDVKVLYTSVKNSKNDLMYFVIFYFKKHFSA